jgi:chemotaxis protein CheC
MPVVVVGFGNRKIGLIVDYLVGKQEIVIKSLEQNYKTVDGLAGASILGDGSICLILDISSMITRVISEQDRLSKYDREKLLESDETEYEDLDDIAPVETLAKPAVIKREEYPPSKKQDSVKPQSFAIKESSRMRIFEDEDNASAAETRKSIVDLSEKRPASTDIPKTASSDDSGYDKIDKHVHDTLEKFRDELRQSIKAVVETGSPSEHMVQKMDISQKDLNEFQVMANIGAANAAESLSKILGKRIDLSIPEVMVQPTEQIPKLLGDIDSIYMGIMLPIEGDVKGSMLFIFREETGFDLIDLLYGTKTSSEKILNEDGESALQELTNIIGSAVINIFAEKTGIAIKPGIPTIVHDFMQSVIDSILVLHSMMDEYAIVMDTAFYYENDQIIGNLLLLPEAESLKIMLERMKSYV